MLSERTIKPVRKYTGREVLSFHDGSVPYFSIPSFDKMGVKNGFTTKFGGVSEGYFAEMNMNVSKEPPEIYKENYRRVCKTLQMNVKHTVLSYQTHTTNIRVVSEDDLGKGVFKPRDYIDTDGLVTDLKDVPLVTQYADCVPLYFYDPIKKCIGLSHAGWRGTLHNMAEATVKKLSDIFGSHASDLYCAIGPSICRECYEVGEEVRADFFEVYGKETASKLIYSNEKGRFQLDLWEANRLNLICAGVRDDHITVTDICTKCNEKLLYSHRVMGDKRGNLAAFLSL